MKKDGLTLLNSKSPKAPIAIMAVVTAAFALSGCGDQAFKAGSLSSGVQSPGEYSVAAKVDILLAEDNTGSMSESFSGITSQFPDFLEQLEAMGWDYRLAVIPLANREPTDPAFNPANDTPRPLYQILPSKYDSNWNTLGLWKPPFPGASPNTPGLGVMPSLFSPPPPTFIQFLTRNQVNLTLGSVEPGFYTIHHALTVRAASAQFLRPDAMTVVLVVGNGNDTSGVTFCTRSDGVQAPCEDIGIPGTGTSSFYEYVSKFQNLVTTQKTKILKFFAAVSGSYNNNCYGGAARPGTRYQQMAAILGGLSWDVCRDPLSNLFTALKNELAAVKGSFVTQYLVLGEEPIESSITVLRYPSGDSEHAQVIPKGAAGATDGWVYEGYKTVYTIESPVPLNQVTGYVIRLKGSAKISGNDGADVIYTPVGGGNSSG